MLDDHRGHKIKVVDGKVSLVDVIYVTSFALRKVDDEIQRVKKQGDKDGVYRLLMESRRELMDDLGNYEQHFDAYAPVTMVSVRALQKHIEDGIVRADGGIYVPELDDTVVKVGG